MSGPQRAAIERREAAVAELVRVVMQSTPGHRYATAYGTLSALIESSDVDPLSWARSYVRQLEEAMSTGLTSRGVCSTCGHLIACHRPPRGDRTPCAQCPDFECEPTISDGSRGRLMAELGGGV